MNHLYATMSVRMTHSGLSDDRLKQIMSTNNVYLLDRSGETRFVFGPYSESAAKNQAGATYILVRGSGLRDGMALTRSEVQVLTNIGSIMPVDPAARLSC